MQYNPNLSQFISQLSDTVINSRVKLTHEEQRFFLPWIIGPIAFGSVALHGVRSVQQKKELAHSRQLGRQRKTEV